MAHLLISTNNYDHYEVELYLITNSNQRRHICSFNNDDIRSRGRYATAFTVIMNKAVKECNELGLNKKDIMFKDYRQPIVLFSEHKISLCQTCAGNGLIITPRANCKKGFNDVVRCQTCCRTGLDRNVSDFSLIDGKTIY